MSANPYQVLGVKREVSQEEIRKAYRALAKKLHPDLNPGNREAEEQFKEVSAAYDLLGDAEKRARFDRGEIDASGAERPAETYYRDYAEAGRNRGRYASNAGYADFASDDDLFADLFGRSSGGGRVHIRMRGQDLLFRLKLAFLDAVNGKTERVTLPDGSTLAVVIPPGIRDGQILRLKGKGRPGINEGPPGDALVEIEVAPHPLFHRDGDDIRLDLPISLAEAVLGGRMDVPTPTGPVRMTIPKDANSGTSLRLRGKGVRRADGSYGDQYVRLTVVLPERPDEELETFVKGWAAGQKQNPRRTMGQ
ncbi:MAG: DnaJ C-terminal domain-containing protein [Acetobacteraceae bacterium]